MSKYQSKFTGRQIDEALEAFSTFTPYAVRLEMADDGNYYLQLGKEYKIYSDKIIQDTYYSGQLVFSCDVQSNFRVSGSDEYKNIHTYNKKANVVADQYSDNFNFKLLCMEHTTSESELHHVYEIDGERYDVTEGINPTYLILDKNQIKVSGALAVYEIDCDAILKAEPGDSTFIRYSANADGTDFTEELQDNQHYIGFATGQVAPTKASEYTWYNLSVTKASLNLDKVDNTADADKRVKYAQSASEDAGGNNIIDTYATKEELKNGSSGAGIEEVCAEVAHTKEVPETSAPYAKISKIGGMTRKCTNLTPYPYANGTHTLHGVTWTVNADGTVTANGTATANSIFVLSNYNIPVSAGTYTLSGIPANGSATTFMMQAADRNGFAKNNTNVSGDVFTLTAETSILIQLVVFNGYTANNLVFKPMLNEGTTALPYEPYFEGLRSAVVIEVESVGVNLFDVEEAELNNDNGTSATLSRSGNDILFNHGDAASDFFVFSYWLETEPNTDYCISVNSSSVNACYVYTDKLFGTNIAYVGTKGGKFNSGNNNKVLLGFYSVASQRVGTSEVVSEIGIYKGTTALPYRPYTKTTIPIPEAVRPKNGINNDVYDYIEWAEDRTTKKCIRCAEKVIDNVIDSDISYNNVKYYRVHKPEGFVGYNSTSNSYVVAGFDYFDDNWDSADNIGKTTGCADYQFIWFGFPVGTTIEEAKAVLIGLTLQYELAEPIITDISDILSADNLIAVEGGGTLTFKNTYNFEVPIEAVFYTGNNEVLAANNFVGNLLGTAEKAKSVVPREFNSSIGLNRAVTPGLYIIKSRDLWGNDGNIGSYTKNDYEELYIQCISSGSTFIQIAYFTEIFDNQPVVAIRTRTDVYRANDWSAWNIILSPIATDDTKYMQLLERIELLEETVSVLEEDIVKVGTNVTGRTVRVICTAECEENSGKSTYTVLDFGNGNHIEACVDVGYYQGHGVFADITDVDTFDATTYTAGGTVAVYNTDYIKLKFVD